MRALLLLLLCSTALAQPPAVIDKASGTAYISTGGVNIQAYPMLGQEESGTTIPLQLDSEGRLIVSTQGASMAIVTQGQSNDGTSPWHVADDALKADFDAWKVWADVALSTRSSESTLSSFKSANHSDLLGVQTRIDTANGHLSTLDGHVDVNLSTRLSEAFFSTFATQNHTDLTLIDSDLNLFKTANHTDVTATTSAVSSFTTQNHTDILGVQTRLDTVNSNLVTVQGKQDTGNASLSSIDSKMFDIGTSLAVNVTNTVPVSQSGTWTVQQGTPPWSVSQSGTWTVGRTWALSSGTDSVSAVQSGNWDVRNITGTVSLPTGASTSALQTSGNSSLSSIDSKLGTLGQKASAGSAPVVIASDQSAIPASQSGTWIVQQGTPPWSVSQSGNWDIRNITGTVSLPTGASTELTLSAFKTANHTDLTLIDTDLNSFKNANHTDVTATTAAINTFASANHTDLLGVQTRVDTTNASIGATSEIVAATDISTSGLNGLTKRLNQHATTIESKLDTVNSNLVTVQSKQDTGNTSLASIDSKVSTAANQATLNTRVGDLTETAPASDTASSGLNGRLQRVAQNITTTNGKIDTVNSNLVTVQGKQDTTNTEIGATNETAPASDTATSGLNGRLQRVAQNLTTLNNKVTDDYGVSSGAVRVASQIGNTTGSASFGAGVTGAQTLRTTSNISDGSGNAITSETYGSFRPVDVKNVIQGPSNATLTTVTLATANVAQQLLAANSARKGFIFLNSSGAVITLGFGYTPVAGTGLTVANNVNYQMDSSLVFTGVINAVSPSNSRTVSILEFF
jgi:hypothetical protein